MCDPKKMCGFLMSKDGEILNDIRYFESLTINELKEHISILRMNSNKAYEEYQEAEGRYFFKKSLFEGAWGVFCEKKRKEL
jgi:hypothetical protein